MNYQITLRNQFKSLAFLIYGSLMFAFLILYLYRDPLFNKELIVFFIIYYLILFIPTLFLHIDYYLKNRKDVFFIDTLEKSIRINNLKLISFNEVESVHYFMPPVWHRKGFIRFLPFEDYHYAKINFRNGEQFVFTSLMDWRVEDTLQQIGAVSVVKNKRLFATTLLN